MIQKEIVDFLHSAQVATICCSVDNRPYCFNCMYAPSNKDGYIVFKSPSNTRHSDILTQNNRVAGTILPDEFDGSAIQGIQFEGIATQEEEDSMAYGASAYYARHPIAMTMPGEIWVVELQSVKFTDNTKGFGYKSSWEKYKEVAAL